MRTDATISQNVAAIRAMTAEARTELTVGVLRDLLAYEQMRPAVRLSVASGILSLGVEAYAELLDRAMAEQGI